MNLYLENIFFSQYTNQWECIQAGNKLLSIEVPKMYPASVRYIMESVLAYPSGDKLLSIEVAKMYPASVWEM